MHDVVILRKYQAALDIAGLDLALENGQELPEFRAGAHIDLHLPSGKIRQYSLINSGKHPRQYQIAVLRDPTSRGGSEEVHDTLSNGQTVRISTPRNHFPLDDSAPYSLLFAGGIGITPMLAMAAELAAEGREFELHYCSRSRKRAAFLDVLTTPSLASRTCIYLDEEGSRLNLQATLAKAPADSHLYVCGPGGFIDFILRGARQQNWSEEQLHREFFSAPATSSTDTQEQQAFELVLKSNGRIIRVGAEQSAYEALAAAGIDIPVSCEQGICGSCITRIVDGIPDHHDQFMTAEEHASNTFFTPCCSRSKSPQLLIDL
jgi:vanillate monooxygenase ferredoxin subunit